MNRDTKALLLGAGLIVTGILAQLINETLIASIFLIAGMAIAMLAKNGMFEKTFQKRQGADRDPKQPRQLDPATAKENYELGYKDGLKYSTLEQNQKRKTTNEDAEEIIRDIRKALVAYENDDLTPFMTLFVIQEQVKGLR